MATFVHSKKLLKKITKAPDLFSYVMWNFRQKKPQTFIARFQFQLSSSLRPIKLLLKQ